MALDGEGVITVIAVRAKDWAYYSQQADRTQEFSLMVGWVVGVLIQESEEALVISQNFFPLEDQVRYTSVIQKREVIQEVRFQVKEEDNATNEADGQG